MEQTITGFHKDDKKEWIAELECGHHQHVRHDPPWQLRPWVISQTGRDEHLGHKLNCRKCDRNEPLDFDPLCQE